MHLPHPRRTSSPTASSRRCGSGSTRPVGRCGSANRTTGSPEPDASCKPKKGPYCVVATQKILDGMAQPLAERITKAGFEVVGIGSFEVVFKGQRDQLADVFARDPHFSKLRGQCRPRVDQMAVPLEWRRRVATFRPVDCGYEPVVETSGREATEYD